MFLGQFFETNLTVETKTENLLLFLSYSKKMKISIFLLVAIAHLFSQIEKNIVEVFNSSYCVDYSGVLRFFIFPTVMKLQHKVMFF